MSRSVSFTPTKSDSPLEYPSTSPSVEWKPPTGGSPTPSRRSTLVSPPIGSHGKVWGRYDNLMDIARRPIPPPPPKRGERRTMSQQGGRWSFYEPISEMYVISRVSAQTPGPGSYGERGTPDSVLSTRASPFGKTAGGKFSLSRRRSHYLEACRVAESVPGPGQYDTDHLGVTGKIVSSLHQPSSNQFRTAARTSQQILPDNYFESFESMTISGGMPSVRWLFQYMQHQADIIAMEQRLVMSKRVPASKMHRLGNTKFSRQRKEAIPPHVHKIHRELSQWEEGQHTGST
mmetsp:Transcript_28490/g.91955  ORF Transcript_28490/g.91955 Transcript_28490/m.91955 type:complete len:289 (-) Transcript_28490:141-1007(-)